jgi:hypothetical protein
MRLSVHVPALAAAWSITRDRRYAEHAVRHLRAWFLDESTLMSPHLLYAQAIKGRVTGRGIGIIDTIHLVEVVRAATALEDAGVMSATERDAVRNWFSRYLMDDDARVWNRGTGRDEQSRNVLTSLTPVLSSNTCKDRGRLRRPNSNDVCNRSSGARPRVHSVGLTRASHEHPYRFRAHEHRP